MNVYISKKSMLVGLRKTQGVTERSSVTPITSNVLIEAKKEGIIIGATNFEVGIIIRQKAKVVKEGRIVIDAKKSYEIIKEMPDEEIHIEKKEAGWVEVSCGENIVFNIAGLSEEEFPSIEIENRTKTLEINAKNIHELIKNTIYAASEDKTRDTLRGLLVEKQKGGLRMVATDGHRLAMADRMFSVDEETAIQRSVVIPQRGAREIKRLIEELNEEKKIKVGVGEKSVVVKGEEETIVIRLIEGEFPNYKKVIPPNNKNRMVVGTKELRESLRRVALVTDEETKTVRFVIKPGALIISSKKIGLGDAREERRVGYVGEEVEVGLNSRYLLDVLNTIEGEEVVFEIMDGKKPVLIREKGKEHTIAVIMPMIL